MILQVGSYCWCFRNPGQTPVEFEVGLSHHLAVRVFTLRISGGDRAIWGAIFFSLWQLNPWKHNFGVTYGESNDPDICVSYDHWCYIKNQWGMMRGTTSLIQFGAITIISYLFGYIIITYSLGFLLKIPRIPLPSPTSWWGHLLHMKTPFSAPFWPHDVGTWKLSPWKRRWTELGNHHFQVPCWILGGYLFD